jgi:hypothetical protein
MLKTLNGRKAWAKSIGETIQDRENSITTGPSGNIYTTGLFDGTVDFDPGARVFNVKTAGSNHIFISKLDANGTFIWEKSMGGTSNEDGYSITTDATGNIYSTGQFGGTADFDPGVNTYNLTSVGLTYDIYISKLCGPSLGTDARTECGSYAWIDGNTYTSSNNVATYNFLGGAVNGCDSIVTLNLTIVNAASGTDTRTECGSYTWIDGITYTSSNNVATYNFPGTANACDSIVTLNLTIGSANVSVVNSDPTLTPNQQGRLINGLIATMAIHTSVERLINHTWQRRTAVLHWLFPKTAVRIPRYVSQ